MNAAIVTNIDAANAAAIAAGNPPIVCDASYGEVGHVASWRVDIPDAGFGEGYACSGHLPLVLNVHISDAAKLQSRAVGA